MDKTRRYLFGFEPFLEGGWLHKGKRANSWVVEEKLVAISVFGDVTIDLTQTKSLPDVVEINAYAIGRDVDVIVPKGTLVELNGGAHSGHLTNGATLVAPAPGVHSVRITGHTFLGDVTTRTQTG
jgi:hypothetical protein